MKIIRLFSMLFFSVFVYATSIQYEGFNIFYGIGQDTFSGYWGICETSNSFSERHIGDFFCETQLWILHHPLIIHIDEGDSAIDVDYRYRYGKTDHEAPEWNHPLLHYSGQSYDYTGRLRAYWSLGHAPLFDLPLDTGEYFLEFAISATVVGHEGDTLSASFIVPDSLPFKAYFTVESVIQSGTEPPSPIRLACFNASECAGAVNLHWVTESETENSHFLIYRDDVVIGQVAGHGTCTAPHDYSYVDEKVTPGIHSYAISDVAYGGEEVKHEALSVEIGASLANVDLTLNKAYPNPFNPRTFISYRLSTVSNVDISIYNTGGEKVATLFSGEQATGQHMHIWDASGLPSGIYVVRLLAGDMIQSQKVVLMK